VRDGTYLQALEADPAGHMQVRICVPSWGAWFNIRYWALPSWATQVENQSGTLDVYGIGIGAYFTAEAEGCEGDGPYGSNCTQWSPTASVYVPFEWTNWLDTDQVPGTAAYDGALQAGTESFADGTRRPLNVCAVSFNGTTQVGKAAREAPGLCFFGYGGGEQIIPHGVVLQGSSRTLGWVQWYPQFNFMGGNPVSAGIEPGNTEYVCRAPFLNPISHQIDTVPGKTVGRTCNISWGGHEYPVDPTVNRVEILNEE
jgi:hypothetical protein